MPHKRQPDEEMESEERCAGSHGFKEKRPKGAMFRNVVKKAMKRQSLQKFLSVLEPLLRRVVKEEVEIALGKHMISMKRHCGKQIFPSTSRSLQLQIRPMLSLPIFTGAKIEGGDNNVISISLVDNLTEDIVRFGPESMVRVEIVVLEGDFEGDEKDNWTCEEFKNNIVKERQGKRTLLAGDTVLNLNEGTGVVNDLSFTDNSSWTRSRKFRLGARVENNHINGTRIKEAMTQPFIVKDHRGELYKKHYPPSLEDDVWRLEKIGKDGAFHKRLNKEMIKTVKDFLILLFTDTSRLRNILGNGMSTKMWDVMVEHARTCILSNQLFVYFQDRRLRFGSVFNIVGELKGIISENQHTRISEISNMQKENACELVKVAYEHIDDIIPLDTDKFAGGVSSEVRPLSTFNETMYNDISTPNVFPSIFPMDSSRSLDFLTSEMEDPFGTTTGFLTHDMCNSRPTIFDVDSNIQPFFAEDQSQFFDSDASSTIYNLDDVVGSPSLMAAVSAFIPPRGRVNRKWRRLLPVFRLAFSLKRIVASKKKRGHEKG